MTRQNLHDCSSCMYVENMNDSAHTHSEIIHDRKKDQLQPEGMFLAHCKNGGTRGL